MTGKLLTCACGASISRKSKSGRCAPCVNADPAVRAKKGKLTPEQREIRAAHARSLSADPAVIAKRNASRAETVSDPKFRAAHSQACRVARRRMMLDPEHMAALRESGRRIGTHNLHWGRTPEARDKARKAIQARHLAWCPEDLWPLNQQLKRKGYRLPERKAIILADVPGTDEYAKRMVANHRDAQKIRHARELAQRY